MRENSKTPLSSSLAEEGVGAHTHPPHLHLYNRETQLKSHHCNADFSM